MKTKLFILFTLTILALSFTNAICQDSVNTYLAFTDYAEQKTLEIERGDLVKLTSVAYSYNGPLWYEKLEILGVQTIYTLYEPGVDKGYFYLFTNFHNLGTSHLAEGTYTLRFTASTYNDCSTEYSELTLIVKDSTTPPEPDTQCPIVTMISPQNGETYENHLTEASFTIEEENELDVCEYTIKGVTNSFDCKKGSNTIPITTKEGSNTLTIYVEDNSSNVCPITTNFNIEIPEEPDTQCPIVEIVYPEDGAIFDHFISTATYNINEDRELDSCRYILNGEESSLPGCVNGSNFLDTLNAIEGQNSLEVFAKDSSGNECSDKIEFKIEIPEPPKEDTQCPIVTMISPQNGETYENHLTEASFTIEEENELDVCEYTINGVTNSFDCKKGSNTIPITTKEGSNTLTIYVEDNSSNVCPIKTNFNIEIPEEPDTQCPLVDIIYPKDGATYTEFISNAIYKINEDRELDSCRYLLNGEEFSISNCINGSNVLNSLKTIEGQNSLEVFAKDSSGNECSDKVEFKIKIPEPPKEDTQCPIVNILSPQNRTYSNWINSSTFTINEDVKLESCSYTLNGISYNIPNCVNGTNYLNDLATIEGINTLRVSATDNSSNTCYDETILTIDLKDENETDEECPTISITYPQNGAVYGSLISTARYILDDENDLDSCYYILNGEISERFSCNKGINYLEDLDFKNRANTLRIFARDEFMNECSDSVTFRINLTKEDDENKTCKDCCIEPDYYNYYYEENKTIPNYYWKGNDPISLNEIELYFSPQSFLEKLINNFLRVFGIEPITFKH